MASNAPAVDEDDQINIEDIEQLCTRLSKYDPCFRTSLIQHHLKRMGLTCTDERLVKLFSLSFETMVKPRRFNASLPSQFSFQVRSIVADCARVNKAHPSPSKTLTSEILSQTLLDTTPETNNHQASAMSTSDINDLFDF